MAKQTQKYIVKGRDETHVIEFRWSISRGRDTDGYNICTCFVDGVKVGRCMGGGYDMQGTAMESWLNSKVRPTDAFPALTWHDPNYKTPQKVVDAEDRGESCGLDRYQTFYAASSQKRTEKHTVPTIDGGFGLESILYDLGYTLQRA